MSRYAVVYTASSDTPEGASNWCACVPNLPGLSAADTREECEALMTEAIPFHIEGMRL